MLMKQRFYLFQRGAVYYVQDGVTGKQQSLQTRDRTEAERLWHARNEAIASPTLNIALARSYLTAHDPKMLARTWQHVLDEFCSRGQPQTQALRRRKARQPAFDLLRPKRLVETTAEDFIKTLNGAGVMIHACLRCLHNLALGLGWLPWPILAPKLWPEVRFKAKRGISWAEHQRILQAEKNPERRLYYDFLWESGASQTDAAQLRAEQIDWPQKTLSYQRQKTGSWACLTIGPRLESLLRELPAHGLLFPKIGPTTVNARSAEFWRRCKGLAIRGISLHSYRYAWAERAKECGYPERFAQEALGHNSKAVHRAYARHARVVLPSLESVEKKAKEGKILVFPAVENVGQQPAAAAPALPPEQSLAVDSQRHEPLALNGTSRR